MDWVDRGSFEYVMGSVITLYVIGIRVDLEQFLVLAVTF